MEKIIQGLNAEKLLLSDRLTTINGSDNKHNRARYEIRSRLREIDSQLLVILNQQNNNEKRN